MQRNTNKARGCQGLRWGQEGHEQRWVQGFPLTCWKCFRFGEHWCIYKHWITYSQCVQIFPSKVTSVACELFLNTTKQKKTWWGGGQENQHFCLFIWEIGGDINLTLKLLGDKNERICVKGVWGKMNSGQISDSPTLYFIEVPPRTLWGKFQDLSNGREDYFLLNFFFSI